MDRREFLKVTGGLVAAAALPPLAAAASEEPTDWIPRSESHHLSLRAPVLPTGQARRCWFRVNATPFYGADTGLLLLTDWHVCNPLNDPSKLVMRLGFRRREPGYPWNYWPDKDGRWRPVEGRGAGRRGLYGYANFRDLIPEMCQLDTGGWPEALLTPRRM